MIYEYRTPTGEIVERDFPMGTAPQTIETDDGLAARVYGNATTVVPEYMRATSDSEIQHYDRRDTRVRKYF